MREVALRLPGVEEGTSYGTPALRVRRRFMARLREDGETLVVRVRPEERPGLLAERPDLFALTPHYEGSALVLMRLGAARREEVEDMLLAAWRLVAPARLVAEHGGGGG